MGTDHDLVRREFFSHGRPEREYLHLGSVDDLDPHIALDTPLSVLNNGRGIATGVIEIRDGSGERVFVDLSEAKSIGDIINAVNNTGFVTASLTPDRTGFTFSKSGSTSNNEQSQKQF